MKYDFDYTLQRFANAMTMYVKCVAYHREYISEARDIRRSYDWSYNPFQRGRYWFHLNQASIWRNTAKDWITQAHIYETRLKEYYENAYYDVAGQEARVA
jgi:hypothetical protein